MRLRQVLDEITAVVVGESAADPGELMKGAVVAHHSDKQIVQHSFPIFRAFRKTDDRDVDIVPRLYLEESGRIVTYDDALGSFADNPLR
jgi:hypothetical protein